METPGERARRLRLSHGVVDDTGDKDPGYLYRLFYEWSDDSANFRYVLRRFEVNGGLEIAEGNFAWAARQAEHYGIDIESDEP